MNDHDDDHDATALLHAFTPDLAPMPDPSDPFPPRRRAQSAAEYWAPYRAEQAARALAHVTTRAIPGDTLATTQAIIRAAVILIAPPWASPAERYMGIRAAPDALFGEHVKCSGCRRRYVCTPEDHYYDAPEPLDRTGGLCWSCVLTSTRDPAAAPELSGVVVAKPARKPRKTRKPAAPAGPELSGVVDAEPPAAPAPGARPRVGPATSAPRDGARKDEWEEPSNSGDR